MEKEYALDQIVEHAKAVAEDWIRSIADGEDRHPYHTDKMYMLQKLTEDIFVKEHPPLAR